MLSRSRREKERVQAGERRGVERRKVEIQGRKTHGGRKTQGGRKTAGETGWVNISGESWYIVNAHSEWE
jgi:hypothetical protein